MSESSKHSRPTHINIVDSDDETLAGDEDPVWIEDDGNEGTPELQDDDSDTSDDDLFVLDEDSQFRIQRPPEIAFAGNALPQGFEILKHHEIFGSVDLTSGINLALVDGDFMRVKHVVQNVHTQELCLHGWRLRLSRRIDNRLRKMAGELCWLVTAPVTDKRQDRDRGLEVATLDHVDFSAVKVFREIVFTNQEAPAFRDTARFDGDIERHVREGRLVCRRKYVVLYESSGGKELKKEVEESVQYLRNEEADEGFAIWDQAKLVGTDKARDIEKFKDAIEQLKIVKKGLVSADPSSTERRRRRDRGEAMDQDIQLINEQTFQEAMQQHGQRRTSGASSTKQHVRTGEKRYKAADICCGGGGASGGISEAPFKLAFGLDMDLAAARTWSLNWPDATAYHMDIATFMKDSIDTCAYAHAIHFSFSCKAWSFANRYKGDFEKNPDDIATSLAAPELLRRLRPRLATFENADGFKAIRKHRGYFNAFLKSIIDEGYNVRWRIIDLARYGGPQHRKRLIVIASCSGEVLPEFPPPTHGPKPSLLPFRTVRDAMRAVDPRDPLHNRKQMRQRWKNHQRRNMMPAPWDDLLPHGITTGGPTDIYPSGRREFTMRECMELMRFRAEHKMPPDLCLTKRWEIIGNAVPRDLIRIIYKDFYEVLKKTDEAIERFLNVDLEEEDSPAAPHATSPGSNRSSSTLQDPRRKGTRAQLPIDLDGPGQDRRPRDTGLSPLVPSRRQEKKRRLEDSVPYERERSRQNTPAYGLEPFAMPQRPAKKPRTIDDAFAVQKEVVREAAPARPKAARRGHVIDLTGDD